MAGEDRLVREPMTKSFLLLVLAALVVLLGCSEVKFKDVSEDPKFRALVGGRYEVVGAVYAYGLRVHAGAKVDLITLIPPPGITSYQVAFKTQVRLGSTITVLKVLKTSRLFDPGIDFVVRLDGTQMPAEAITIIEIFRGNEGKEPLQLNPAIYRKL